MSLERFANGGISVKLVLSYVVDWLVLVVMAAVGVAFSSIPPNRRPFDITDPSLSYPLVPETISNGTLILVSLIGPSAVIFVICLFIGLGSQRHNSSRIGPIRRKLWELNAGWMGLALALAVAFVISSGAKEVVGKPRPDLLARCDPDLSKRLNATVGGVGDQIEEGITLFSWKICRNSGAVLDEGFRSFPSAHSSFSFAGLTYLALWICAKLGISIPFLSHRISSPMTPEQADDIPQRSQAAAPPTYLLIFPLIPIGAAIYISGSRYSDFWHHGFDVVSGSLLGVATAWLGFRWYHLPIRRGGGWAWAPRSPRRAFGKGIGVLTYVDSGEPLHKGRDLEAGGRAGSHFHSRPFPRDNIRSSGSGERFIEMNDLRATRDYSQIRDGESSRAPLR